jgi:uncharacterized HAD superfamily protein
MRPRIYVDVDDVLCHTALALTRVLEEHFGRRVPLDEVKWFDLSRSFGLSRDEHERLMELAHRPSVLGSYEPVAGAREVLGAWRERGYDLVLCTGRPPSTAAPTRAWLRERQIPYSSILFVDKYGRHPEADSLRLDEVAAMDFVLAVEDSWEMATFLSESAGLPVALVDRPWNRTSSDGRIVRCSTWADVARAFPAP